MAKVEFTRVETNDDIENIDIKDGRFIVTGEGKAFVDYGENRIGIGGTPDTQMSDSSTNSVENRVIKEYVDDIANSIPELSNEYGTSNENGYTQEYINELETYSTDEIRVGTWIDGKPLYRIVLQFPNGTQSTDLVNYTLSNYGITNVDTIFIVHPSYYSFGNATFPFQYNDGNAFACNVNPTILAVKLGYNQIANSPFLITLEYTKTTD